MNYKEKFKNIKNFVFDVDGVLTNGGLYILPSGEFMRKMNVMVNPQRKYIVTTKFTLDK